MLSLLQVYVKQTRISISFYPIHQWAIITLLYSFTYIYALAL